MEETFVSWSKSCFLFCPCLTFFPPYRLKIKFLTFFSRNAFYEPLEVSEFHRDMWHLWRSRITGIHRPLCERFSLGLVSTKEIVPTKTVAGMFCGSYSVTGTVLFWKEMLLLNVFIGVSTSNEIPLTSVLLGSSRNLKAWYLKTWANETKPVSMTRYLLEMRKLNVIWVIWYPLNCLLNQSSWNDWHHVHIWFYSIDH